LHARKIFLRVRVWGIEDNTLFAGIAEELPDGWLTILAWPEASNVLLARDRLEGIVDAMFSGKRSGIQGWPGGHMEHFGRGVQAPLGTTCHEGIEDRQKALFTPAID
jgi:hypothetical protein